MIGAVSKNDGDMVNQVGLSRKHILDAVDDSVKRLGTYIDVLQIHRLDRDTPKEEIMRALNDVIESGKVRYIGASSVSQGCASRGALADSMFRWPAGSFKRYKTLPRNTAGTNSSRCRITTTSCTARRSAR